MSYVSESFFRECLWSPTVVFVNLEEIRRWKLVKRPVSFFVRRNATVGYISNREVSVACKMNFEDYPFDKQVWETRR